MKDDAHIEKLVQAYATCLLVTLFAGLTLCVIFRIIPEANKDVALQVISTLNALVLMLFGFWYGSSKGARENRQKLNDILDSTIPTGENVSSTSTTTTKTTKEPEK